ncbi:MAG: hypothetical protein A2X22_10160 [Bacteroidetes bacterium GWF2_49_14]|nr:MAG: hypothetical protein A2X22_10160 [Bacteroidetes bacterium GWF2_49_14]
MPDAWRYILKRSFRQDSAWTWIFLLASLAGASLTWLWIRAGIRVAGNPGSGLPTALLFAILILTGIAVKTLRRWSGLRLDMLLHYRFENEILKLPVFCNPGSEQQTVRYRALWHYTEIPFRINLLINNLLTGTLSLAILLTPNLMNCLHVPLILIIIASIEFILSNRLAIREHQFEMSQSDLLRELSESRIECVKLGSSAEAVHRISTDQTCLNKGVIGFEKKRRRLILLHRIPQAIAIGAWVLAFYGDNHRLTDLPVMAIAGWRAWQAISGLVPVFSGWVRIKRLVNECYMATSNQAYNYQNDTSNIGGDAGQPVPYRTAQVGAS